MRQQILGLKDSPLILNGTQRIPTIIRGICSRCQLKRQLSLARTFQTKRFQEIDVSDDAIKLKHISVEFIWKFQETISMPHLFRTFNIISSVQASIYIVLCVLLSALWKKYNVSSSPRTQCMVHLLTYRSTMSAHVSNQ